MLGSVLRFVDRLADHTTGLLFLVASVMMFAMVVTRYVFAWSDASVEIIARYMMIWATFLGVAAAARRDINIRFTLIEAMLGPRGRRLFRTFGYLLAAVFAIGLGLSGVSLVDETRMFNEVMPTALRWPIWIFHAAVPVGGFLLALQLLVLVARIWRGTDDVGGGEPAAL
ncbi:MAG: TRAP transporter small permease [Alphaproteobacteria bacterium]|nr:TRAP transporter small permease [Alphaproteobacteria bacterium]